MLAMNQFQVNLDAVYSFEASLSSAFSNDNIEDHVIFYKNSDSPYPNVYYLINTLDELYALNNFKKRQMNDVSESIWFDLYHMSEEFWRQFQVKNVIFNPKPTYILPPPPIYTFKYPKPLLSEKRIASPTKSLVSSAVNVAPLPTKPVLSISKVLSFKPSEVTPIKHIRLPAVAQFPPQRPPLSYVSIIKKPKRSFFRSFFAFFSCCFFSRKTKKLTYTSPPSPRVRRY